MVSAKTAANAMAGVMPRWCAPDTSVCLASGDNQWS
ncbi:Uncharacterised protein [Mycobacterium tuberculosis]|nr:Uncharacterised protein [Mycobacterium tuberculosis]